MGFDLCPWEGVVKWKYSLCLRSSCTGGEISWDRKGTSEDQREVWKLACGRQNTEGPSYLPVLPRLRCTSSGTLGDWVLKFRFLLHTWGEACGWLHKESLKAWVATDVHRYKLLYIKWINSNGLLYSTGNYIQYPVIMHNGE